MMKVRHDNQYVSYEIQDNARFFPTGYRVLKKQKGKGLIPCSKIHYNGHIKLLYPIAEYESIFTAAEEWDADAVCKWLLRLLEALAKVREIGFLQTVDVDLTHIFIAEEAKQVCLIVLPLTADIGGIENQRWEEMLEKTLLSLVEISQMSNRQDIAELKNLIRKNITSLDALYEQLKQKGEHEKSVPCKELHLIGRGIAEKTNISVTKEVFILGKNPKLSDGVLTMSPTISRQHCKITLENAEYYIEDLGSLNHTYIDGEILEKGKKVLMQNGTKLRLAEVEFEVEFV